MRLLASTISIGIIGVIGCSGTSTSESKQGLFGFGSADAGPGGTGGGSCTYSGSAAEADGKADTGEEVGPFVADNGSDSDPGTGTGSAVVGAVRLSTSAAMECGGDATTPEFYVKALSYDGTGRVASKVSSESWWSDSHQSNGTIDVDLPQMMWDSGGNNTKDRPVTFKKNTAPTLTIKIRVTGQHPAFSIRAKDTTGAPALVWDRLSGDGVAVAAGNDSVDVDIPMSTPNGQATGLPNAIARAFFWRNTVEFQIKTGDDWVASSYTFNGDVSLFVVWDSPSAGTLTGRRASTVTARAEGGATLRDVARLLHHSLSGGFLLNDNCAANPWSILDANPVRRVDCISLTMLLKRMLEVIGAGSGDVKYGYGATAVGDIEKDNSNTPNTMACPDGSHTGPDPIKVTDSGGSWNNWEATLKFNSRYYPGGFDANYPSLRNVMCAWYAGVNGARQRPYDHTDRLAPGNETDGTGYCRAAVLDPDN